jgi:hypothetical protein
MRPKYEMRIGKLGVAALVVASAVVLLGCSGDQAMTAPTSPGGGGSQGATVVLSGNWGGSGVVMEVGDTQVRIEFACARAILAAPISLDASGTFTVAGTYYPEGPGPIHQGDEDGKPATFLGRVSGNMMKLAVTIDENSQFVGTYGLEHGKSVQVHKCQ